MRYKVLRKLVAFRRFANTERGEKIIVRVLTVIAAILVADVALLVVGFLNF